jgi:hypothetical protein
LSIEEKVTLAKIIQTLGNLPLASIEKYLINNVFDIGNKSMTAEDSTTYHSNNEVICKDDYLGYTVFFEDNGRVAYAYLLKNEEIISDVWLYNHGLPPSEPEWHSYENLPFVNPINFALNQEVAPAQSSNEILFKWNYIDKQQLISVEIYLREMLCGILEPGLKPGYARFAVRDSPIAKVMYLAGEKNQ